MFSPRAQAQLDAAARQLASRPDLFRSRTGASIKALRAMRSCVSSARAPGLATLNIRVFRLDGGSLDALGAVYVRVEDIPVGRTAAGGTLRAQVPSGHVMVTALVPSTAKGVQPVTVEPGASLSVSVGLDGDVDVVEETDVIVGEAVHGVLPLNARSLTLKFTDGDRLVRVVAVDGVELLGASDDVQQNLTRLFTIRAGAIVAREPRAVLAAVRPAHDERATPVRLHVQGVDAAGFTHANVVAFRVQ